MGTYLIPLEEYRRPATVAPLDISPLVGAWLVSLRSDCTRDAYRADLAGYLDYLDAHGLDPLTAPRAAVDLWLNDMKAAGLAASTRARRLSAVRNFYRYAIDANATGTDPTANVRPPYVSSEPVRVGLTLAEARAVIAAAMDRTTAHRGTVALLLGAALRVSEAAAADVDHIGHQDGHTVLTVTGKGDRRRLVPLSPLTMELLGAIPSTGPLVRTPDGERLDRYQMAHLVRALGRAAGLDRAISPHILRHTAATLALDSGAPVQTVADLLGHSSPATTMRYVAGRERLRTSAAYVVGVALAAGTEP